MALKGVDIHPAFQPGFPVGDDDLDFVFVKATEGTGYTAGFRPVAEKVLAEGRLLGLYHFIGGDGGAAEAEYFVKQVRSYVGRAMLCLDWEGKGATTGLKAWAFVSKVHELTGVWPVVYGNRGDVSSINGADGAKVKAHCGLWLAAWVSSSLGAWPNSDRTSGLAGWSMAMWQCGIFSAAASRERFGYNAEIDVDWFYGNREAWMAYATPDGEKPAAPPKSKPKSATPAKTMPAKLTVDGLLGPASIRRWQEILGTPPDGEIWKPSDLVKAVQKRLNAAGARDWDGKKLKVDGLGIGSNIKTAAGKTRTIWALQVYLKTTPDGILSKGGSPAVEALQKRLNSGKF